MNPGSDDWVLLRETVEKSRVREVLENYFQALDAQEEDRLAACYTEDAVAIHHYGSDTEFTLTGGGIIARYFAPLMRTFTATTHAACNSVIAVNGDAATASTFAIAHVIHDNRVRVRGLRYIDELVHISQQWRIRKRKHIQLWQYEADAVKPFLPR